MLKIMSIVCFFGLICGVVSLVIALTTNGSPVWPIWLDCFSIPINLSGTIGFGLDWFA